jgi:hypothetical protein
MGYASGFAFTAWIIESTVENHPIGNLSQWDDLLSDLEATFWSWFIANGVFCGA